MEVRPPTEDELAALRGIEQRAGRVFADVGLSIVADDEPSAIETLDAHRRAGTIWVAVVDDRPVAYATASEVDGEGHLDQVSVDPDHARRGIGRVLIERVCDWAAHRGLPAVTLTTYRDVAWNGPLYERYGFHALADGEVAPELAAIRATERARGLDVAPRVAMRRWL